MTSERSEAKTTKLNTRTAGLEKGLDEFVNKKQPLQLPADVRKWIADNSWWLALIGGILSIWGTWGFWQLGHYVDGLSRYTNDLAHVYGSTTYATELGPFWYLALFGLLAEGILLLMAVSKLKDHKKAGWDLLFYVSLINLIVGIIYLFVPGYGIGSLLVTLLGAAVAWFFLFQIRNRFLN